MNQTLKEFFEQYQRATATSDLSAMGGLYQDTFMFAGANGVKVVKKEDFLKVIPKMKTHLTSIGLTATELQTVDVSPINAKYYLAKTAWRMTVVDTKGRARQLDALATYVLEQKADDTLSIVFQIDHQDLATVISAERTA